MSKSIFSIITIGFLACQVTFSQIGTICKWNSDKKAAVVLTFDDWTPGQYPIAVPELKKRDLVATFFPMESSIASWNHPWSDVLKTAANGNEFGNHTRTHTDMTKQTAEQLTNEIRVMKGILDAKITSQTVVSFAYPMGLFNNQVIDSIIKSGHIAARSVMSSSGNYTYNFATKESDYYRILTYGMDGTKSTVTFFNEIKKIMTGGGLLTYMYHSLDNAAGTYNDNWYAKVLQDSLQNQLDALLSVKDQVWITTLGQAIKYHRQARCATLSEITPFDGTQWIINLTDTLSNNAIYNQPLSIKLNVNGNTFTEITQDNKILPFVTTANGTIMFHAVPDKGHIVLKTSTTTNIQENKNNSQIKIYTASTSRSITIEMDNLQENTHISLLDMVGRTVKTVPGKGSNFMTIDVTDLKKGAYIVQVKTANNYLSQKVILQ